MAKKTNKRAVRAAKARATTYEIDIAQEFKDVKLDFKDFKTELSNKLDKTNQKLDDWKTVFDRQLTTLNDNMKSVMDTIAKHEYRFTEHETRLNKLETIGVKAEVRREDLSNKAKVGWLCLKVGLGVGAIIGAVGGCGLILKLLQII